MRKEYDFSQGVQGKYAKHYEKGCIVVILEPDVARRFPDAKAVNRALRALADTPQRGSRKKRTG